jgi:hypothetical protein
MIHMLSSCRIPLAIACVVVSLRPVGPVLSYVVNFDYISSVLCVNVDKPEKNCQGKCFLKISMNEALSTDDRDSGIGQERPPVLWDSLIEAAEFQMHSTLACLRIFHALVEISRSAHEPPFVPPEAENS